MTDAKLKISDALTDVCRQAAEMCGLDCESFELEDINKLLMYGKVAWNIAILPDDERLTRAQRIKDEYQFLLPKEKVKAAIELTEMIIELKLLLYPEVRVSIVGHSVIEKNNDFKVRVEYRAF
jgi:hypothetical protein